MHLVQLFLPLNRNSGEKQPHRRTSDELSDKFGGLTVYSRAPAKGVWEDDDAAPRVDEMLVYEVMTDALDHAWWARYRTELEDRFQQEVILIRALPLETL